MCESVIDGKPARVSSGGMTSKILRIKDVALYLGVPVRTLYDMLRDGRFPVKPIPHTKPRRWNVEHIDVWLNANRVQG